MPVSNSGYSVLHTIKALKWGVEPTCDGDVVGEVYGTQIVENPAHV